MEKITLTFSANSCFQPFSRTIVTLTLDENGKNYSVKNENKYESIREVLGEKVAEENIVLPKRILTAFTESAVNKILSKDEIPNESGFFVLDGNNYEISITKGEITNVYQADDASIETYTLLRYLASWYRNINK